MLHDPDGVTGSRVDALLATDQPDDHLLVHLKLLAAEAVPADLLSGVDPAGFGGVRVGGVALEMNCPADFAVYLLRATADAIERDYLAALAAGN